MSSNARSDDDLLAAASADPDAFAAFYRRYERAVLAFFGRRTRDWELAADLTAETFAAALVSCRREAPAASRAAAWLFTIARNKLVDSYRRGRVEDQARRGLGMSVLALDDDALERVEAACGEHQVVSLVRALPADQREAVEARILDELSYDEVSQRLQCSNLVARKRVSRGLETLRSAMKENP